MRLPGARDVTTGTGYKIPVGEQVLLEGKFVMPREAAGPEGDT